MPRRLKLLLAGLLVPVAALVAPSAAAKAALVEPLAHGALLHAPCGPPRGVLVLLHGAGEGPATMIERLRTTADERGLALVAVKAAGVTWDVVASARPAATGPVGMKVRSRPRLGRDARRIGAALDETLARLGGPRAPVVLAGFSDGASAALSVGLAEPDRYAAIVAMSPGLVLLPDQGKKGQEIVITHGRRDPVLPFAVSRRDIAGLLERVGYRPQFIAFEGEHRIDLVSLAPTFERLFGAPAPAGACR